MCGKVKERNTFEEDDSILFTLSAREILKIFRKSNEVRKQILYFKILSEAKISIINGDSFQLFKTNTLLSCMRNEVSALSCLAYRCSPNNPLRNANIIILACKYGQPEILVFILSDECKILQHWPITIGYNTVLQTDIDDYQHNAFYYAIRSGIPKVVELLIEKWPNEYPFQNSGKLQEALSNAYRELKLKNVKLSIEMEVFVRNVLFEKDFFHDSQINELDEQKKKSNRSDRAETQKAAKQYIADIEERIKLVLSNITTLTNDFAMIDVNDTFLVIAKFIVKNIHVLKSQLKCTYDKIPWEEMEFCLIIFSLTATELIENHLLHARVLSKNRILMHLNNFRSCLENAMVIINQTKIVLYKLPILKEDGKNLRESCVLRITKQNPLLKELYKDYDRLRDDYSLKTMKPYLDLAISVKCDAEGKLLITRALQVVGEHIKNTLESPKLSDTTCELLLFSLPDNTKEIVKGLRDSLSHADSMAIRVEIEKRSETFFNRIQEDLKKLINAIVEVFCQCKIRVIRDELKKISECENEEKLKEIWKSLHFENATEEKLEIPELSLLKEMQAHVTNLSFHVKTKSQIQKYLFEKVNEEIISEMNRLNQIKERVLKCVHSYNFFLENIHEHKFENVKIEAKGLLHETSPNINWPKKSNLLEFLLNTLNRVKFDEKEGSRLMFLTWKLFNSASFQLNKLKLIEEYKSDITENKRKVRNKPQKQVVDKLLSQKLSQLKNVLDNVTIEDFTSRKSISKHQVIVEMLVLDIYSLLEDELSHDHLFLDAEPVKLIGRNMRNHLAHENTLINVLSAHALVDLVLNAENCLQECTSNRRKIGNPFRCSINKLQIEHEQDLGIIALQKEMFMALSNGDLEIVKNTIKKGADVKARYMRHKTALHFASEGTSIEAIKLILAEKCELVTKDANGQSALHIAALHGRSNIVEYLMNNTGICVDQLDRERKTPMHIAAELGHLEVVNILLKFGASTTQEDVHGYTPVHYSVQNNHEDIFVAFLNYEGNVDENEAFGGWTPLHIASSRGHLRLVNYLIRKRVNVKSDTLDVPLHVAVQHGHVEIVRTLIENGANVNARNMYGFLPLHVACMIGQDTVLPHLLEKTTNVDDVLNIFRESPLSFAAKNGRLEIVKLLLKHNANVNIKDSKGVTPLHFAVDKGHQSVVEILIQNNASLEGSDYIGNTAMHYGAFNGHKHILNLLIQHGCSINVKNLLSEIPLNLAILNGHLNATQILIDKKANVNNKNFINWTALHECSKNQFLDITKLLIESGANIHVHVPNLEFGITPFQLALSLGSKAMIEAFEAGGAKVKDIKTSHFTALHLGIINGDLEVVQYLIDLNCDVNAKSKSGLTALHLSILIDSMSIIELLVKNNSELDLRDNDGCTPLEYAVQRNKKIIVQYLIKNGAKVDVDLLEKAVVLGHYDMVTILLDTVKFDVNVQINNNSNLLITSVLLSHKKVAEIILEKGADINATPYNVTPLFLATGQGNFEMVKILLEKGADPHITSRKDRVTPLFIAIIKGHTNIVDILLQKGATKVDSTNKSALQLAVEGSRIEIVNFLLENNHGNANERIYEQDSLLHIAATRNLEIVKCLVTKGVDPNVRGIDGLTPLIMAAASGQKDIVQFLHSFCVKTTFDSSLALKFAVKNGHFEVAKYLVESCVDVNSSVNDSDTFLHLAAKCNQKDILLYFLSNGAYYNAKNRYSQVALYCAQDSAIKYALKLVKWLFIAIKRKELVLIEEAINKGAILDAKRKDNATPLHYAAWKGHCDILDCLLKNGANPNIIGKCNSTPLHYASKFGHYDAVKSLLSHGAIYNILSDTGKFPLQYSTHNDITELLSVVDKSFTSVQNGDFDFFENLKSLRDPETIRSVMKSKNKENKLVVNFAIINGFPKIKQLKQILEVDTNAMYAKASEFDIRGKYSEAFKLFEDISKIRSEVLGQDHPDTLDIKDKIGEVSLKQKDFDKALNVFDENFKTRKDSLGDNDVSTLHTKKYLAISLHRLEQKSEAMKLLQEVYTQQSTIFGECHPDVLDTQTVMAYMLEQEGKDEDALAYYRTACKLYTEVSGENNPQSLEIQFIIAMILIKQEKHGEAIKILQHLYDTQKLIQGEEHPKTLKILSEIAHIYTMEGSYNAALKLHKKVRDVQETQSDIDNLSYTKSMLSIGTVLNLQQKIVEAFTIFAKCHGNSLGTLGPNHPLTQNARKGMEFVKSQFCLRYGAAECCVLEQIENEHSSTVEGIPTSLEQRIQEASDIYLKRATESVLEERISDFENLPKDYFINCITKMSRPQAFEKGDDYLGTESLTQFVDTEVFHFLITLKTMQSGVHVRFDDTGC